MDRRDFMRLGAFGAAGAAGLWLPAGCTPPPDYNPPANGTPFTLGVLSGLHSTTEVVLWTRLDPTVVPGAGQISWSIATDAALTNVVDSGTVAVGPAADWTAKVLAGGLDPDTEYWYRFSIDGAPSPAGRARTLPPADADTPLRLAFASCQNWASGWYTAWASIAQEQLDAVVWLGDYIYESSGRFSPTDVRSDPNGSVDTLAGYRAKYRLYRSDPNLQAGHSAHPFVPVWDDHEFSNNYSSYDIAQEPARAAAAYQAWFEYMPVWPIDGTRIYRGHRWGRTADLSMLDTRQYRDRQANGFVEPDKEAFIGFGPVLEEATQVGRTIMGAPQRQWLKDGLSAAQDDGVVWKLLGNQVMITPWRLIDLEEPVLRDVFPDMPNHNGVYLNLDCWDSYMWERDDLFSHIATDGIDNVAVLTGDVHMFFQSSMRENFDDESSPIVVNEFVGGGISSPAINILRNDDVGFALEGAFRNFNPRFSYCDFRRNGYGVVEATTDEMTVSYRAGYVWEPDWSIATTMRFRMQAGNPVPTLEPVNP